ncbi:hypothetical protein A0056_004350 [Campylobacter jejuni]|nr:hypothetical protein A0056_004350 [Campylobacter jejuni]SUX00463.1 YopX protein [Campylobacter jejuni subsp. doylei]
MKLKDFDFRIWDKTKEEFLKKDPTLIKLDNERVIAGQISIFYANTADITDMLIGNDSDLEIELWTGYFDKNGKKIYEGDIVKVKAPNYKELIIVGWRFSSFVALKGKERYIYDLFKTLSGEFDAEKCEYLNTFEIIGNIHENKELLK